MLIPKINWTPFDKNNPPMNINGEADYLIFLREDWTNTGQNWIYHIDVTQPYGTYLDNFWDTTNDWDEGQLIEVLAFAELPCMIPKTDINYVDI